MKVISIVLVFIMSICMLISCGGTVIAPETNVTDTDVSYTDVYKNSPDFPEKLKNVRFDNSEVGILASNYDGAKRSITAEFDAVDNSVESVVYMRNKYVENYLGVSIKLTETVDLGEMTEYLRNFFSSPPSSKNIDIIALHQNYDLGLAYHDFGKEPLADLNESEYINPSAPYWDGSLYDTLKRGESAYYITGDLSLNWLESIKVSYVNKQMWNDYKEDIKALTGYSDIYDIVKNGKWTLQLINELNDIVHINNDGNESVVGDGDQHGVLIYSVEGCVGNDLLYTLFSGSNGTFSTINSETELPEINFFNQISLDYFNCLYKLFYQSKSRLVTYDLQSASTLPEVFKKGDSLVTFGILDDSVSCLSGMEDGYYILPIPKLENGEDYTTTVGSDVTHFGILSTSDNISAADATLELLAYYSYKTVTPVYYNLCIDSDNSQNNNSREYEILNSLRTYLYSDFAVLFGREISQNTKNDSCVEYLNEAAKFKSMGVSIKSYENQLIINLSDLLTELGFTEKQSA